MKFAILLSFVFLSTTQSCGEQKAEPQKQISSEQPSSSISLKKRPESPLVKVKKELRISGEGTAPFIIERTDYDKKGNIVSIKKFDFYGSGEQVGSTTNKYAADGNMISSNQNEDGQTTNYSYKYNDKNQKVEEIWKRKNGQGEVTKFSYDANGNIVEQKYLTLQGQHDYSRIYEYEYDPEGNIISEKKWEKYTDGSADLLSYHFILEYNNGKLAKKTRLTNRGNPDRTVVNSYDANGLKIIESESSRRGTTKTVSKYNEYGEEIETKLYSINKEGLERLDIHTTSIYDKYGNKLGYTNLKGSTDSYGTKFEYEFYK